MTVSIALETPLIEDLQIQCLTPRLMRWSQRQWLLDVSDFMRYWKSQARRLLSDPASVWRKVLEDQLTPAYRAACAPNPWQAALLLESMKHHHVEGLVLINSPTGQKLFHAVSWEMWWHCAKRIDTDLKYRRRLELAMERLNIQSPWDMQRFTQAGMQRRFGKRIAQFWQWTFGQTCDDFPWMDWLTQPKPTVTRGLDYPLCTWDQIEPLLRDDLDKLAENPVQITQLNWELVFYDDSRIEMKIDFRYPHDLKREQGRHTTALLQARYQFEFALQGFTESPPDIISWQLVIALHFNVPPVVMDLFGNVSNSEHDLMQLENELPVPLLRYDYAASWKPDESYVQGIGDVDARFLPSLAAAAQVRPLFLYKTPQPIPGTETTRFLERVGDTDYVRVQDFKNRRLWAANNQIRGVFG